nr:MAG TPA: hypothetical protein [Caudoviricetes sp.]
MAERILTLRQAEDIFLEVTREILGISNDNSTVRLAYGAGSTTGSAPMHDTRSSVCYVTVNPTNDGYGNQHHICYESTEESELLTEVDEYTEEYSVIFSCYGIDSYDKARKIRDGLYGENSKKLLRNHKIYLVVGSPQLIPAREIIDTRWIERCDLTATFYSTVRVERADTVGRIDEANVKFTPTK